MSRSLTLALCLACRAAVAQEPLPSPLDPSGTRPAPSDEGGWMIEGSTEGGFEARTPDGRTVRPKATGETKLGDDRTCPGKGTWPTCF